uniref:C-repeat binding factor 3 n=1 Tax=Vitis vinifera TaxID=29760 RepID=A0A077B3T0_VITVI|nr:C-repeat binding factor 3 [Vitis vinifera]
MESERDQSSPSSSSSSSQTKCSISSSPVHKRKAGRKKFRETRHPVYRGVRQRNGNRYNAKCGIPKPSPGYGLGLFPLPKWRLGRMMWPP